MDTMTFAEAMQELRTHRKDHIENARKIADELIAANGETSSKEVCDVMQARGLFPQDAIDGRWLGAVFQGTRYKWTGKMAEAGYTNANTHAGYRPPKVWTRA